MALINCPECKREIFDKAPTCLWCGAPVTVSASSEAVTSIQATSKNLKGQQVIAFLMIMAGLFLALAGSSETEMSVAGPLLFLGGLVWFIVVRVKTWWKHG